MKKLPKYHLMPDGTKIELPYIGPRVKQLVMNQRIADLQAAVLGHRWNPEIVAIAKRKYTKGRWLETIPSEKIQELSIIKRN